MAHTIDVAVAELAERQHGVFAILHLDQVGVAPHERKYRLASGRWIELHLGVYRLAGAPLTPRGRALAACWAGGTRAVLSHRAAAAIHCIPGGNEALVEITCPHWRRTQHGDLIVHESRALPDRDIAFVDGIPVTTIERTIFDLCSMFGRRTIEMAIDNALRRDLTTFDRLAATLRRLGHRGVKGTKLMRTLLAARDPLQAPTESERETMLVDVLRSHGLPEPVRQHIIRDEADGFVARVDLAYPDLRIAIEYDSYQHHVGTQQLVRDSRRRNAITALGWIVLVGTAEDVRLGKGHALASAIARSRANRRQSGPTIRPH